MQAIPAAAGSGVAGGGGGLEAHAGLKQPGVPTDTNPGDVAFKLNTVAAAASYGFQLRRDLDVFARARHSMRAVLRARPST